MKTATTAELFREAVEDREREKQEGDWSLQYSSYSEEDDCIQGERDYEERQKDNYFNLPTK